MRQLPQHYRVLLRMIKEKENDHSPEGKSLPLGFTGLKVNDAKYVHIPIFKPERRKV